MPSSRTNSENVRTIFVLCREPRNRGLLLIGARDDDLCKIEGYEKLYERAREPKKLAVLPITHYEIYSGKWFDRFLK